MKKKWGGGEGGLGGMVRVDLNEELKFLGKFTKKKKFGGGGVRRGGGQVGGRVWGGQGGCERRIEVLGKNYKKKIREVGGSGGGGDWWGGQGGCERNVGGRE